MTRPLLATKLYLPKLRRGLVPRARLLERMGRGAAARVTLVSAPAGFGKTTLLAEWLAGTRAADRRVAWLSLDPADNDPAVFWSYVVTALQTAVPAVSASALQLLASSPGAIELVLTTVLNELAAAPGEVWLVLDDYHVVNDHAIGEAMAFVLEHLPNQVHVVLSTRADPDLPLARWRARGELVEIRVADLRFTSDEAAAYLNAVTGLELAAADVAALEERTEGWIAALQLAALSLRGRADVSGFIAGFAGDDRYIVDYLVEEVLQHQPDAVRAFLLETSVLERLTGPLCDALTGRADGSDTLVALERANLFVVALDDRRDWYRYHHLFADVLRARLLGERPEDVPQLHLRASEWYEHHGLTAEAVVHSLAARDFDRAVHLIELAVPDIRRHRQEASVHGWLKALPEVFVRRSPMLSVFYGSMLMVTGDLDAVESRLEDAERGLTDAAEGATPAGADTTELRTLPATIAIYRASLAQARGDVVGTTRHAQRALDLAGPDDHLARGGAAGFLGLAAWANGDVSTALATFTQAVTSLHAAGNLVDELSSTVVLADLSLTAGRPGQARRLYERALQQAEAPGGPLLRATADLHVGLSEIDVDVGELESARRHLATAAALGEGAVMPEGHHRWYVASARLAQADGNPDEAVLLLNQAEQLYRPGFFPDVRPIAALRARVWIAQGKLSEAGEWASELGVTTTDDASYLREFDHLTLVRLVIAQHRAGSDSHALHQALGLLDRLLGAAETSGRGGSVAEIRRLQGRVQSAMADAASAPGSGTRPAAAGGLLSERELQVMRLLGSELSGPDIARELFVSHNTLRTHTKHIYTKLDVTSRQAAVRRARENGLLT